MKRVHLIQSCELRNPEIKNSEINGFDAVFSCCYLGSAEFEWGALPKSLHVIVDNQDKYELIQNKAYKAHDARGVFVLCKPEDKDDIFKAIDQMALNNDGSLLLQERTSFKEALAGERYYAKLCLWWDIENHWFVFFGKETGRKLQLALDKLKEKWGK